MMGIFAMIDWTLTLSVGLGLFLGISALLIVWVLPWYVLSLIAQAQR